MAQHDFSVEGRQVVVVGAARSGLAAAELLRKRGAHVTLSESRASFDEAGALAASGIQIETGGHQPGTLAQADLVVVSPGVPLEQPVFAAARDRGVEIIGELELAWRWLKGPVIAITGTKGKSTTTTLIGRMLDAAGRHVLVGGNIGVPVSAQVEASTDRTVHVVEVSSFQLATTTSFRPWMAVWLNLTDDHLDRHASLQEYGDAKARIFANQVPSDFAVVNADDPAVVRYSAQSFATRVWFSLAPNIPDGYTVSDGWIGRKTRSTFERLAPVTAVRVPGQHMLGNIVAATAAANLAGAGAGSIEQAVRGFTGLEHVMEHVATIGKVRFVNDSKATNVGAARKSIESFEAGVVAIIGGRYKGGNLSELKEALAGRGRGVVAIGDAASQVEAAMAGGPPVVRAGSMAEAVARAYDLVGHEGVVLLAPACASFDWFRDYADRGRSFKEEVEKLRARLV
ncbi:MAG TPA: UDP-N-acetylmuramoyl-L-alanine--D-glutamate ligase [Vicinamibacterales bacterium]|jgi:UDP-N-acetylmuramoylalanine--D-glutamate ligase|nr:UDP-N-acetylmuramoyl-L-alanine--D-glutamate ligase [Vicinamibacterales bacterium]